MVLKNRRTLATTASYSASTTSTIALPRDFLIQRMSGVATETNQYAIKGYRKNIKILDK